MPSSSVLRDAVADYTADSHRSHQASTQRAFVCGHLPLVPTVVGGACAPKMAGQYPGGLVMLP
jgi:hypothetical protein